MAALLYRVGGWVARHRLAVIVAWIGALVAVGVIVSQVGAATTNDLQLPGTDSQRATDVLAAHFPPQQNGKSPIVFYDAAHAVTAQRESGVLKRRRGTPVPASVIITGRALTSVVVALAIRVVLLVIGWIFYSAHIPARAAPALVITVILGAVTFCCLGYALVSIIRNDDAAQPITQAVVLPLYFISGVFVPVSGLPQWLNDIAQIFPVSHLAAALLVAYNPHTTGFGFSWNNLAVLILWGIGGFIVAMRRFTWVPRGR
jgi:ABC-2 type transport system permease protein